MAKAKKSKAKKPAKAKSKAKVKAKSKATSSRAAASRKAAAAKSARAKKSARKPAPKKAAAKKATPKKTVAKRSAPGRRAAPVARPAPRPAPSPAPMAPPVSAPAPIAPPPTPASEPAANMGDGEATDEEKPKPPGIREAVASFATQAQFRDAVKRLLTAGFAPTDLSILASHDSLEVAGGVPGYRGKPGQALIAGLTEEAGLLAPLQVAGFSALSGGPVAGAVAALVTAGLGAWGLRDVIEKFVANHHSANYVEALKAGNLLLWVRVADTQQEWKALVILGDCGGVNAHINTRKLSGR
jgi:hypothetical protein